MGESIGITAARVAAYLNNKLSFERLINPSSYKTDFETFVILYRLVPTTDPNRERLLETWLKMVKTPKQFALINKTINEKNGYNVKSARKMLKGCEDFRSLVRLYWKIDPSFGGQRKEVLIEIGRRYLD